MFLKNLIHQTLMANIELCNKNMELILKEKAHYFYSEAQTEQIGADVIVYMTKT